MKQKKMLSLTLSQIRQLYCQELPELTAMAQQSLDDTDFKNHLQEFLTPYISGGNKAGEQIRLLISYDGYANTDLISSPTLLDREFGKCRNTY